jgi:DNA-binding CsgD family transcriptional regulator
MTAILKVGSSVRIIQPAMRFRADRGREVGSLVGVKVPTAVAQYAELVEREAELAAIAELVGRAKGGSAGVTLIEGPAGVGKTRLIQAAGELAAAEPVCVLRARGGELERSFPFGVAVQLFGAAVAALGGEERASVLSGAAELAVDLIDPRVSARSLGLGSPEALFARFHGLYWLCAGLAARQPLLLLVDDAHWADDPSLQWLLFMARRLADVPVTLLLSARPESAGGWPEPLVLLRGEADVAVMRPNALSEGASRVLIGRLLQGDVAEPFCAACHRATAGNPFLLSELIASVRADGIAPTAAAAGQIGSLAPEAVVRSIVVRLGRMSRQAAAVARCVSVLGGEGELRHVAALAELEVASAAVAADALAAAGLLDSGRPLRLVHPIVRTALYSEMPAGERGQLHARAARLLAGEHADVDAIAAHLLVSEPAGERWRVELLLRAGERAAGRGSSSIAADYLRRALAEPPPADLRVAILRRLGGVEARLGDPVAVEHALQARALISEPRESVELAYEVSVGYLVAGRFDDSIDTLEQAIETIDERDNELRLRLEAQLLSLARLAPGRAELVRRHLHEIPHDLPGKTPGERMILAELAFAALIAGEPVDQVADLATRAFGDGQLIAEQPPGSLPVLDAIWALVFSDQHHLAMRAYDRLITTARKQGWPIAFALISSRRSEAHYRGGSIPDAIADARASIEVGRDFAASLVAPALYGPLMDALLQAGDTDGARHALADSGVEEHIPYVWSLFPLIRARGHLRLAQGKTEAGIEDLLAGYEVIARVGLTNPAGTHCRSTAAVALASLGRREQARQLVADELAAARRFGAHSTVGISLRAAGVVEAGVTGISYLREAVSHLELSPARLEHARALAELGAALRRAGKRREAQHMLRQALDLADRCGDQTIANQARTELLISGARPRRARIAGLEALTASERRVAQLAADGLTNREIAQALFVSLPTVVTHLGHCYQKLDIRSRRDLANALAAARADID